MRFLLVTLGTFGDVYPFIHIGSELRRRGHDVRIIANPYFQNVIQAEGFDFEPLGTIEQAERYYNDPEMWHSKRFWKAGAEYMTLGPMRPTYEIISRLYVPNETVVAAVESAIGARIAHEKLGVPLATIHPAADKIRSVFRAPVIPGLWMPQWMPRWFKSLLFWIADRLVVDPVYCPTINAFRAELGLPPISRPYHGWWNSPQRVIGLYPKWFNPPQPDWPKQTVLTGFPIMASKDEEPLSNELLNFLSSGTHPVVFSFGSINRHSKPLLKIAVDTCGLINQPAVILAKDRSVLPNPLPANVFHTSYVPFNSLFSRTSLLVHNGGLGTTSIAMRAGIPQIIIPLAFGNANTAALTADLKVATAMSPAKVTPKRLAECIKATLQSKELTYACKEIANKFDVAPIQRTCDLLQELAGQDCCA